MLSPPKGPFVTGNDADGYEVPKPDDTYEEVGEEMDDDDAEDGQQQQGGDQVYANEERPGRSLAARQRQQVANGYVVMGNRTTKAASVTVQVPPCPKQGRRSPRDRHSSKHCSSAPRSPSPMSIQQQSTRTSGSSVTQFPTTPAVNRLYSISSESTYMEAGPSDSTEGAYENPEADDLDKLVEVEEEEDTDDEVYDKDVKEPSAAARSQRTRRHPVSAKDVRRWKVESSAAPRMTKRIKTSGGACKGVIRNSSTTGRHTICNINNRTLLASPARTSASHVASRANPITSSKHSQLTHATTDPISRFSYIYGSVNNDSDEKPTDDYQQHDAAINKVGTLDRLIPVYETFKSATLGASAILGGSTDQSNRQQKEDTYIQFGSSCNDYDVERRIVSDYDLASHPEGDEEPEQGLSPPAAVNDVSSPNVSLQQQQQQRTSISLSGEFQCPVCDEPARLAAADDGTTCCSFVAAMQELLRSQTVGRRLCGNCDRRPNAATAVCRCLDCRQDLCTICRDAHATLRLTRGHRIVGIRDLQTGRYEREIGASLPALCAVHADISATALCIDCDRIVCAECRGSTDHHAGHRTTSELDSIAARQRDFIGGTLLDDAAARLAELKRNAADIADYGIACEAGRETVLKAVTEQRDRLVRMIDDYFRSMVDCIGEEYEFERDNLFNITTALERACARVEHCSKFVRQLLDHGRPVDVVSLASTVKSSLRSAASIPPVTIDARLVVDYLPISIADDDIQNLMGVVTIDRLASVTEYGGSSASLGGGEATKDEQASNAEPGHHCRTVSVSSDGSQSGGMTQQGALERSTKESGSAAASGIQQDCMVVREPVLVVSFPARVPSDAKGCKPTAVAVTRNDAEGSENGGETLIVVVDDINKKVKIFDVDGKLQLEIHPDGEHRLVDPWDAAVLRRTSASDGGSGRYAVTDRGAKDVKVFDIDGKFVFSFGTPHLACPWGIASNGAKQILVTDTVRRTVFVHDAAGTLLFSVERRSRGAEFQLQCPEYVAVSPVNGDIVVTDFERHNVVIFDKFGRFLAQFSGADTSEAGSGSGSENARRGRRHHRRRLEVPCGVAVSGPEDDGHIYVADYNNRRIARLTRNGRYVGCFASGNSASTSLVCPQALDFAANGLLVVADRTNVKMFDVGISRTTSSSTSKLQRKRSAETKTEKENVGRDEASTSKAEIVADASKNSLTNVQAVGTARQKSVAAMVTEMEVRNTASSAEHVGNFSKSSRTHAETASSSARTSGASSESSEVHEPKKDNASGGDEDGAKSNSPATACRGPKPALPPRPKNVPEITQRKAVPASSLAERRGTSSTDTRSSTQVQTGTAGSRCRTTSGRTRVPSSTDGNQTTRKQEAGGDTPVTRSYIETEVW
jgi:hypothetical protein